MNDINNQKKIHFINTINFNLKVAQSKFDFLKNKYGQTAYWPAEENKKLYIKIEDSIQMVGWYLELFIKSERALDDDTERSFLDTIEELEWRLKEFDGSVQGNDHSGRGGF